MGQYNNNNNNIIWCTDIYYIICMYVCAYILYGCLPGGQNIKRRRGADTWTGRTGNTRARVRQKITKRPGTCIPRGWYVRFIPVFVQAANRIYTVIYYAIILLYVVSLAISISHDSRVEQIYNIWLCIIQLYIVGTFIRIVNV